MFIDCVTWIGQDPLSHTIRHQNKLGWFCLLTGRISTYWAQAQQDYYFQKNLDKLPCRWAAALIKQAFLTACDLWKDQCNIKHSTPTAAKQQEMAHLDAEMDELQQISTNEIYGHDPEHLDMTDQRQHRMTVEEKC